jgi:hypothetical protein
MSALVGLRFKRFPWLVHLGSHPLGCISRIDGIEIHGTVWLSESDDGHVWIGSDAMKLRSCRSRTEVVKCSNLPSELYSLGQGLFYCCVHR